MRVRRLAVMGVTGRTGWLPCGRAGPGRTAAENDGGKGTAEAGGGRPVQGDSSIVTNRSGSRVRGPITLDPSKDRKPGAVKLGSRRATASGKGRSRIVTRATLKKSIAVGRYSSSPVSGSWGSTCAARRVTVIKYVNGARSGGDSLFEIGNGGYDALHYEISLDYDPLTNQFNPGTYTKMTARPTEYLRQFSLDFEGPRDLPDRSQPKALQLHPAGHELIITPRIRLDAGRRFTVKVEYSGYVNHHVDPDESLEAGFARLSLGDPGPDNPDCFGSFTVSEPIGAQTWFPNNNVPSDKATFTTTTAVPTEAGADEWTALGTGNSSRSRGRNRRQDDLEVARIPADLDLPDHRLRLSLRLMTSPRRPTARITTPSPLYNAYDNSATPTQVDAINTPSSTGQEDIINEFSALFGPYPLKSGGVFAGRTSGIGYECWKTRARFTSRSRIGNLTLAHERPPVVRRCGRPRQLEPDLVQRGWAQWGEWFHESPTTPADAFTTEYESTENPERWDIPPGTLNDDPSLLFDEFSTYIRPGMMLEGIARSSVMRSSPRSPKPFRRTTHTRRSTRTSSSPLPSRSPTSGRYRKRP